MNWRSSKWLIGAVFVLWSMGRAINPLRHYIESSGQPLGGLLVAVTVLYVVLHVVVLGCALWLMLGSLRRPGSRWEILFYAYVLATIVVSLYFIGFEFGYFPWLVGQPPASL